MTKFKNLGLKNNKNLKTTIEKNLHSLNKNWLIATKNSKHECFKFNPLHGHKMLTKFSMVSHQNSLRVFISLNNFI
jgi:hypothetical protein